MLIRIRYQWRCVQASHSIYDAIVANMLSIIGLMSVPLAFSCCSAATRGFVSFDAVANSNRCLALPPAANLLRHASRFRGFTDVTEAGGELDRVSKLSVVITPLRLRSFLRGLRLGLRSRLGLYFWFWWAGDNQCIPNGDCAAGLTGFPALQIAEPPPVDPQLEVLVLIPVRQPPGPALATFRAQERLL